MKMVEIAVKDIVSISKDEAKALKRHWSRHDDITKFNTYAHVWAYVECHSDLGATNQEKIDLFYKISKRLFEEAIK